MANAEGTWQVDAPPSFDPYVAEMTALLAELAEGWTIVASGVDLEVKKKWLTTPFLNWCRVHVMAYLPTRVFRQMGPGLGRLIFQEILDQTEGEFVKEMQLFRNRFEEEWGPV